MGVVYFSIIPTFEPSRYCKCWIVCFYNIKKSGKRCYVCPFAWGFVDLKIFFNDFVVNRDHMVKCLDFFGAALFLKLGHGLGDIQDIIHFMCLTDTGTFCCHI